MLFGQRLMKSLCSICPLVRLSICQFICLSLSFLKIGSLVFSDIVRDDSWPWYLVTDRIWAKWAEIRPKTGFFLPFSQVFLEIACNDSLQQCITSSRGKPHKKVFGDQIWAEAGQNLAWNYYSFQPFSQVWFISFPWNYIQW